MILGARLLLLVVIVDCFLYFGMGAVSLYPGFGNQIGQLVNVNGTVDGANVNSLVNYSSGGTMVQASTLGYTTTGIQSILGFAGMQTTLVIHPPPRGRSNRKGILLRPHRLVGSLVIKCLHANEALRLTGFF